MKFYLCSVDSSSLFQCSVSSVFHRCTGIPSAIVGCCYDGIHYRPVCHAWVV
uniref:Uncharacterized protein n=1 Tax=Anguilla anguilla TaxID=7936 RepID=A0A0E9PEH3_ANGAN